MKRISQIGTLLKKIYRVYSQDLVKQLQDRGFVDLRPSFLDLLIFLCHHEGSSIKTIGKHCGLKKQTMTSHLNELEKRGYITRVMNPLDKREQQVFLTEYGERFKLNLDEAIGDLEEEYLNKVGSVEMERVEHVLGNFHKEISDFHQSELF